MIISGREMMVSRHETTVFILQGKFLMKTLSIRRIAKIIFFPLKNKFSVGVGYELGLANICKSNEDEFDDDWGFLDDVIKWRNRNFQVTLGYRF